MLQSFKMALKSIWGNKMRSFLTMLGIIIGVASVIILVSIVNGYMSYMTESFASMGVNQITVNYRSLPSRTIDVEEFYEFYEENQDLFQGMTPSVSVSATVKHGSDTMDATTVGGYSEDQLSIKGYELSCGRNLLYSDMASRQKVAVVGAYVASELFGSPEKALGEKIKLNGDNYTVVGVVEQQTESAADFDDGCTDDFVWIPYSRAAKIARNAVISNYTFTSYDINDTDACTAALEEFLRSVFGDGHELPDGYLKRPDRHDVHDVRRHCRDLSFSGRRGRYEYHAGIGHRAYQGDRYQEGSGSQKTGDPPAVCHRGGCDQHHRRSGGNPAWLPGQRGDRYAHGN